MVEPGPVSETGAEVGLLHCVVDGCAKTTPSPSMAEGEVLGHGDTKEVSEVGNGDWAVGPGFEGVDCVPVNHVCWSVGCDIVFVTAVAVIGEVVSKNDHGGEWIRPAVGWGRCRGGCGGCWGVVGRNHG